MKFKIIVIATVLLLSVTSAQADMQLTDWKVTGDEKASLDTETGIEWLHVSETEGMGAIEVISLLDTTYAGWRLPTADEVSVYFMHMLPSLAVPIGSTPYVKQYSEGNGYPAPDYITTLQTYMGKTGVSIGRTRWNYGMYYEDGTGNNSDLKAAGYTFGSSSSGFSINIYVESDYEGGNYDKIGHVDYGVFLVSDGGTTLSSQLDPSINSNNVNHVTADVSAPALLGLGLGLFGFAARRRSSTTLNK
jgi:hypothetical protein